MMQPPVRLSKRLLENTGIRNPINQDSVGQRGTAWEKNGERGKLGQERLEVGWEVVMFLFNIVNLNV